jgi:hypothetical protein
LVDSVSTISNIEIHVGDGDTTALVPKWAEEGTAWSIDEFPRSSIDALCTLYGEPSVRRSCVNKEVESLGAEFHLGIESLTLIRLLEVLIR